MLSIGDLSKTSGVKVPTIRYYEKIGLIEPADRSEGNQRRYETDDLKRLTFIKHARDLGFPLEDVRSLLALKEDISSPCQKADKILSHHLADVRDRIERLRRLESELERMSHCQGECVAECSVIESLADHSHCLYEH
ncbi:helix-turn-helix domain-containing protein [uncultured Cohaesibacter sp.]|uniref:MerR family transcriptional regulator n=1 Tax=uncultured Cohaesibacter sp. TaxID=1002546 RepID=UPI0029C8FAC2|nr:helix-turn-helix domain-containing protein [uncultured Cohaesibacter sp.]